MKLTELDPRWFSLETGGPRVGLTFDCPHCVSQPKAEHIWPTRLGVVFHHSGHEAIEDEYIHAHDNPLHIWTMTGTDFHDLTLAPSVDASGAGHWHGFIANGEAA